MVAQKRVMDKNKHDRPARPLCQLEKEDVVWSDVMDSGDHSLKSERRQHQDLLRYRLSMEIY